MVMWHCAYDQIDAYCQSITQQCDLRLYPHEKSTQMLGAALGVFGIVAIIVIIPFLEKVVFPAYSNRCHKPPSPFVKVVIGSLWRQELCSGRDVLKSFEKMPLKSRYATVLETEYVAQDCFILDTGAQEPMNDVSWIFAIPMYVLIGVSECLNITAFDVFYSPVPHHLKSTCQAINLFMVAMGENVTFIFTLLFTAPDNLNLGHLGYMFFAVGVVSFINL